MSDSISALDHDIEHGAISRAWEQVSPDELVPALRDVPAKMRGRMLSRLKTPSSKVTTLTARMLITNLGRTNHQDRFRAADTICRPFIESLGDAVDDASDRGEILAAVQDKAEKWGKSLAVLAAVAGLVNETERFAPALVACADAGWLNGKLAELAEELTPTAEQRLAANTALAVTLPEDDAALEDLWHLAVAAAGRVQDDVASGGLPDRDDLEAVDRYTARLLDDAARFDVEATVAAVGAASTRAELDAALAELASKLRRLRGPDDVASSLAEVHAAAGRLSADRALAERLSRFLEVVNGGDAIARLKLSGQLRTEPAPPDGALLDAAMIGLLGFSSEEAPPASAPAATDRDGDAAGALPTAPASQPAAPEEEADSSVPTGEAAPSADRRVNPPETPEGEASPAERAEPAVPAADAPPAPAGEVPSSPTPTAPVPAVAAEAAGAATGTTVEETAVDVPAATADHGEETHPEEAHAEDAGPDAEECARTLAALISARRYSLAAHLADALGQELRPEVLREAALAEAVRRSASPAAAALVERALSVPVPAEDRGSVALRVASACRAALIDPASGAAELLRPLLDASAATHALNEFAVAVLDASVQNLSVSTSSAPAGESTHEQAATIASWAADTIARPRHRVGDVGKAVTSPGQPVGDILAALAGNDVSRLAQVRDACRALSSTKGIDRAISDAEAALTTNHVRVHPIVGGARQTLVRAIKEVVDQGWAWCEAYSVQRPSGGLGRVEAAARELRERLGGELDGTGSDEVTAATLAAASASLAETIDLLFGGELAGSEPDPVSICNRDLVLVAGLSVDDHGTPVRPPTADELVRAATTSRADAFASRLDAGDYPGAEAVTLLPAFDADSSFDPTAARRELRDRERDARKAVGERWQNLQRAYASARARGRIGVADAAELGARLEQSNPEPEGDEPRRDLGQVATELEQLRADLDEAAVRRREAVQADIDEAKARDELSQAWTERLDDLIRRGELGAAEEYLHRARAGETTPDDPSTLHQPDETLAAVLASFPSGITADVVELVRSGGAGGPLDFTGVDAEERSPVVDALVAWQGLRDGERPANLDEPLLPVLRLLGIIPRALNRPPELRAASKADYWFVDIDGEVSGKAYVPDYGSRSGRRRRFMLCWATHLPVAQLWDLARSQAPDDQPIYVLYFGMLSAKGRVELARRARGAHGKGVVVIDAAVLLCCAAAGRYSYDVTMRTVLPYAAPNPYDPNLLSGMPPEMFYGRRAERESVKSPSGTSIISGGRRFGKSALLRSAQQELGHNPDVVVELLVIQDVAAPPRNDPSELWPRLAARLIEKHVLPAETALDATGVCAGIRAWLTANPHKRLLVMLDECDFFLRADANNAFTNVVHLRNEMAYNEGRFKVVFSGLQHVARYRRLPNQPLSHFSHPLVIGPLDAPSASELVRRPLAAVGWAITDAQVDRIVTFCACNPSVTQLTCAALLGRLNREEVADLAPWTVPDEVVDDLLQSAEIRQGLRAGLFLTLELDHRYKLLAYLMAWRADTYGLAEPVPPAELRRMAAEWWPEGFASQRTDDVRALCDELVGLGVFAGDAETGYRMLSPGMVRVFGDTEEINDELVAAADNYDTDVAGGAAGSRMRLETLGANRFSPLTSAQLADVLGAGQTQLRVVVGSRATRVDAVPAALVAGAALFPASYATVTEVNSLRTWRDSMRAPAGGHMVVVSDMTVRGSEASWEQSIDSARRRGATRSGRGTRSAVLVAGPDHRWLLRQMVDRPDGSSGNLADVAVPLSRVDAVSLQAWNHIEDLAVPSQIRQRRLLAVTGGWPFLVERVFAGRATHGNIDHALDAVEAHLATPEGAAELVAAVGLDPEDPDQPADRGLVATFDRLVDNGWVEGLAYLAGLLELDDALEGIEQDPAEAVAILALLGVLDHAGEGLYRTEPVLTRSWKLRAGTHLAG